MASGDDRASFVFCGMLRQVRAVNALSLYRLESVFPFCSRSFTHPCIDTTKRPEPARILPKNSFVSSREFFSGNALASAPCREPSQLKFSSICAAGSAVKDAKPATTRNSTKDVVAILKERGLVQALTADDMGEKLNTTEPITVYAGFDPTADSLHVGNLVAIMALAHFQRAGHRPIAIVGGATGLIGDPSGRTSERDQIQGETIQKNLRGIQENLTRFLQFDDSVAEDGTHVFGAKILNNMAWYEDKNVVQFIREVGKYFRLSSMLAKESVKIRLEQSKEEEGGGMSFTEFTYQIFQAYDFLHLARSENCRVQVGGSDQWGNITAGTELIRKVIGTEVFGVTLPLLTTASGEKFGKSAGNAIWLNEGKTSCYDLYQYFLRVEDADVEKLLKVLTFIPVDEIMQIVAEHSKEPEKRLGQRILAEHVTRLIHGEGGLVKAQKASDLLFGSGDLAGLSGSDILAVFKDVPSVELEGAKVVGADICSIAVAANVCKSKGEARRLIQNGGLYLNNDKVSSADRLLDSADLIDGSVIVLRQGKKNYRLVRVV